TNKALEGLDVAGWERAEPVLASLAAEYAAAERMEEANEWRHPIDLVAILERSFGELQEAARPGSWDGREELVEVVLGEDPPSVELLRGVFDAAMSVYLDRFLNVPAVRLPEPDTGAQRDELLAELPQLLDKQQQVNEAGALVASYLAAGGDDRRLLAALGAGL